MGFTMDVVFNDFPTIASNLDAAEDAWAEQVAMAIANQASENTVRVDSGDMKGGWRVAQLAPGIWIVYNTQFYAVFHEFGTFRLSASPMLVPAVETLRNSLPDLWRLAIGGA